MKNIIFKVLILTIYILPIHGQIHISILGTGYVGLVTGAGLAYFGHKVICTDIDKNKIDLLNTGEIPIYEPGLKEIVHEQRKNGNLQFTNNISQAIKSSDIVFITVGTPMADNGQADLSYIYSAAKLIGKNLNAYKLICIKSTVPVGTNNKIKKIISKNSGNQNFDLVSNPEFLREGSAVYDFFNPDRVIIGLDNERALNLLNKIYIDYTKNKIPFCYTDLTTSELIKYASNAFLANKISFINEIANICELTGANILDVANGIGLDKRIGRDFLNAGAGFGGSCFPKDLKALIYTFKSLGIKSKILNAVLDVNNKRKKYIVKKLLRLLDNEIEGKAIGILGLAFKANTDDVRESPAIDIIKKLIKRKAIVKAFDPIANKNMQKILPNIDYCYKLEEMFNNIDALIILTDCNEFKTIDLENLYADKKRPAILDARNILNMNKLLKLGFKCENIGNAAIKKSLGLFKNLD